MSKQASSKKTPAPRRRKAAVSAAAPDTEFDAGSDAGSDAKSDAASKGASDHSAQAAAPEAPLAGLIDAQRLLALQTALMQQQAALWQSLFLQSAKPEPSTNASKTDTGTATLPAVPDRRFSSPAWSEPWYDWLRRSYLLNSQYVDALVESMQVDARTRERMRFAARQIADAMSPANFAATNPEAVQLALESNGESLSRGIRQLMDDTLHGRIATTDETAFEVGRNLATTAGAVVFENEVMQLIQYQPLTAQVRKRPLLIVPPCINKFYILDLQPANSLVRYALEQGNQVFMISWRNPVAKDLAECGQLTWDDYLERGIVTAIDQARQICGADQVNALGFCVGGTMLGTAAAAMAARGEHKLASLTLLASMLDFSDTGEIGLMVDEASVAAREAQIGAGGLMSGRDLAMVFSSLRANDLVWSYVVNNYLKGQKPDAFDLLYWNADSTNMPGPWYCWYVRNTYLENNLRLPGKVQSLGVPVDLGKVGMPAYLLATREDHIVPWRTAWQSVKLLSGGTRFVLGASGHVAGVINPVAKKRRSYWSVGEAKFVEAQPALLDGEHVSAEAWLAAASEHPGSWWSDWDQWLAAFGDGMKVASKHLGDQSHPVIEPAPGRYVRQRML